MSEKWVSEFALSQRWQSDADAVRTQGRAAGGGYWITQAMAPALYAALPAPQDPAVAAALLRQLGGCKGCGDPGGLVSE